MMKSKVLISVCFALFTLLLHSISAAQVVLDNFSDNRTATGIWMKVVKGTGPTVKEVNKRVEVTIPANATGADFGACYQSVWALQGDFDVRVDFKLLNWPRGSGVRVFLASNMGTSEIDLGRLTGKISRRNVFRGDEYEGYKFEYGDCPSSIVGTNYLAGKLRLTRVATKVTAYYWQSGWKKLDECSGKDGENMKILFGAYSDSDDTFCNKDVKVSFSNFTLQKGTLLWP